MKSGINTKNRMALKYVQSSKNTMPNIIDNISDEFYWGDNEFPDTNTDYDSDEPGYGAIWIIIDTIDNKTYAFNFTYMIWYGIERGNYEDLDSYDIQISNVWCVDENNEDVEEYDLPPGVYDSALNFAIKRLHDYGFTHVWYDTIDFD